MTDGAVEVDHDRKWADWQAHSVEADRKSTLQVRIAFGVVAVTILARLAVQVASR